MEKPSSMRALHIAGDHRRAVRRHLLHWLRSSRAPDDFAQALHARLRRMDPAECARAPLANLFAVAASVVADLAIGNTEQQQGQFHSESAAVSDELFVVQERVNLRRELARTLAELPPLQACALLLHYQEGLGDDEIARRLAVPIENASEYLTQGKARVNSLLMNLLKGMEA